MQPHLILVVPADPGCWPPVDRGLVLARDEVPEPNLVWKDTVLVRTGQVVDILFDVTNPGLWMAHCHIAEHMRSGMMFSFNVTREQRATSPKEF